MTCVQSLGLRGRDAIDSPWPSCVEPSPLEDPEVPSELPQVEVVQNIAIDGSTSPVEPPSHFWPASVSSTGYETLRTS